VSLTELMNDLAKSKTKELDFNLGEKLDSGYNKK
jgi:hypothetical protein